MTQGKRRASGKNYTKLNSNVRQRKENKKNAKTGKQQNRKQSKKKCNENNNTVFVHKNVTGQEKTQGKNKTTGKKFSERKIKITQTAKARKDSKTAKQNNKRPTLAMKQVANRANFFFRFQFFKKKSTNQKFKIKKYKSTIGREFPWNSRICSSTGAATLP